MKKLFLAFLLLAGTTCSVKAQTKKTSGAGKFSIGVDAAVPTGITSVVYNMGIGGSIKYELPIATDLYFTISAGYEAFLVKREFKVPGLSSSDGFIPLKAGIKYYFKNGLFAEAQAGVSIYAGKESFTSFLYSPGIGYSFAGGFEAGVRYEAWVKSGTMGQVALRAAFRF